MSPRKRRCRERGRCAKANVGTRPGGKERRGRASGRDVGRPPPHRTPRQRVLIVCEGEETEPTYFNGFRIVKRLSREIIDVKNCKDAGGTLPKQLVEFAKELRDDSEGYGDSYDSVWCVFDRDKHLRIDEAFVQARDNGINVAFSNPSFELWYLLHFRDQGAHIEGGAVVKALRKHIKRYEKSNDLYKTLEPKQQKAIERARQLRRSQHRITDDSCLEESPNPSTWVDKLVETLNAIE